MTTRIELYFAKKILINFSIILIVLSGILILIQLIQMLDLVINKGVGIVELFKIVILVLPNILTDLLPFALLGSIIFTWSSMNNNNEMIIIQSLGITPYKLTIVILKISLLITIINAILISYLAPVTYSKFRNLSSVIKDNFNVNLLDVKKFTKLSKDNTIYISSLENNTFKNIIIYDTSDQTQISLIHAEDGYLDLTSQTDKILLVMSTVNIQIQSNINSDVSYLNVDKFIFPINTKTSQNKKNKKISEYTLYEILNNNQSVININNKTKDFSKEISYRVFNIIVLMIFSIICAFFFIFHAFSRRNNNLKPILFSIACAIIIKSLNGISYIIINSLLIYNIILIVPIIISLYMIYIIKSPNIKYYK